MHKNLEGIKDVVCMCMNVGTRPSDCLTDVQSKQ